MYTTILTLWKQGKAKKEISRITGKDRKTVRKIIQQYELQGQETPSAIIKASRLSQYHTEIVSFLEAALSIVRIHEKLQELGCSMAYSSVKRYVSQIKCSTKICVRFHSSPGEEA